MVDEEQDASFSTKHAPYLDKENPDERKIKASSGIIRDVIEAKDRELERISMAMDLELQLPALQEVGTTSRTLSKDIARLADLKGGILDSKALQDAYRQITVWHHENPYLQSA